MRGWNLALWVAQLLLAGIFGYYGWLKATAPMSELVAQLGWPAALPPGLVRFIGGCEVAGALGLLLPAATRIVPVLTPLAGAGLAAIMVLASIFHGMRGELGALGLTVPLGGLAVLVALGRWRQAPVAPR
jgi:hypothetical protein